MPDELEDEGMGEFALGLIAAGMWGYADEDIPDVLPGVRFLDPNTADYAESGGTILRTTNAKQRVINCLVNAFGSSMAVRGVKMPATHGPTTSRFTDNEVRTALRPLLNEGAIVLNRVDVSIELQSIPGRLGISVDFTDPETGALETVTV